MWNRLAVVLTGLALLVAPLAFILHAISRTNAYRQTLYEGCLRDSEELISTRQYEQYQKATRECWSARFPTHDPSPSWWGQWWDAVFATAIVCAVLYALIFVIVQTVKWVWRGRSVNKIP